MKTYQDQEEYDASHTYLIVSEGFREDDIVPCRTRKQAERVREQLGLPGVIMTRRQYERG